MSESVRKKEREREREFVGEWFCCYVFCNSYFKLKKENLKDDFKYFKKQN